MPHECRARRLVFPGVRNESPRGLVPRSTRGDSALFSCWGLDAATACRAPAPVRRPAEGRVAVWIRAQDLRASAGWPLLACMPSCLPLPPGLSGRSLQLYMHWPVGDSFLSSPSDREVKRPHLVGPDLWVTSEVAMQTWGSLPRREKSFPQPGCEESTCLAWPRVASRPVALLTVSFSSPSLSPFFSR